MTTRTALRLRCDRVAVLGAETGPPDPAHFALDVPLPLWAHEIDALARAHSWCWCGGEVLLRGPWGARGGLVTAVRG